MRIAHGFRRLLWQLFLQISGCGASKFQYFKWFMENSANLPPNQANCIRKVSWKQANQLCNPEFHVTNLSPTHFLFSLLNSFPKSMTNSSCELIAFLLFPKESVKFHSIRSGRSPRAVHFEHLCPVASSLVHFISTKISLPSTYKLRRWWVTTSRKWAWLRLHFAEWGKHY